ncbi:hypothetical protein ACNQKP_10865 [Bdellovibrio bacteriovorus]|uniref:hypothetical protein n=1 Tax=Bdellovibrio bacteriovorus TaxID=959 RepID=UPI003AA9B711
MQFDANTDKYFEHFCKEIEETLQPLGELHEIDFHEVLNQDILKFGDFSIAYDADTSRPTVVFSERFVLMIERHLTPLMTYREQNLIIESLKAYRLAQEILFEKPSIVLWATYRAAFEELRVKVIALRAQNPKSKKELNEKIIRATICSLKVDVSQEALAACFVSPEDFKKLQEDLFGEVLLDPHANEKKEAKTFKNKISEFRVAILSDDGPGR